MDDPRETLKQAGVECAEVDALLGDAIPDAKWIADEYSSAQILFRDVDAAILALAELVAKWRVAARDRADDAECYEEQAEKYKRQRDQVLDRYVIAVEDEWGISHWRDDKVQPRDDSGYLSDEESREKWKARLVDDLGKNEWDELRG